MKVEHGSGLIKKLVDIDVRGHARAEGHLKDPQLIHSIVGRQQVSIWVPVILNIFFTVVL